MLTPLPSPVEMKDWDAAAIREYGIREEMLMENASREALHVLLHCCGEIAGKSVLLFMGGGNNGGDAAALARHLHDLHAHVLVLHSRPLRAYRGAAGYHLRLARRTGVSFLPLSTNTQFFPFPRGSRAASLFPAANPQSPDAVIPNDIRNDIINGIPNGMPDIIIDGLLGTGFCGPLAPLYHAAVAWINSRRERCFVLSLDIPSGLDGLSGEPGPVAVRAHATVTFEAAKPGLHMPPAGEFTGALHCRPIGIPKTVRTRLPASHALLDAAGCRAIASMLPLAPDMHKGTAGHVLVIGGSPGMTGAPVLAAQGAQRSGAGYVTVAAPGELLPLIAPMNPDILTCPAGPGKTWEPSPELNAAIQRADALVIGPGMGRGDDARELLARILGLADRPPAIFDADALYHLARTPALCDLLLPDDILTPHPGEMSLLAGKDVHEIQRNRLAAARGYALQYPCVLVLKGAGTLIAQTEEPLVISPFAAPALAVAGSGDVLAGLMGGLSGQGLAPRYAACLAVYLHARAGTLLHETFPMRGNTAQDIATALTIAQKELVSCLQQKT
ncbi:NAD(P)H-hydrate dehydratase [Desulfovibrio psychrotolerans]|uniref:Bifunctional NAD(P)H-hydrate repair enzyme n=1 Tax=Desulfovibrio psychrotolerans TaxID=415242 RepID=A0A7J0BPK1_9BACT|nr:NAD(P)H-hydrate dehydratase [Desulfovibrio psychrotolerans]GFM35570.1 bifunctional NAD(P)H-hydrate repair enzyme [Desulfovibrio psychrotolerans]